MAILPSSPVGELENVEIEQLPSKTWRVDQDTKRISGLCDGLEAVRQAVEIILNVERFAWQIFRPYSGRNFEDLIGQDVGYVVVELQRRITDALTVDDRIPGIRDFDFTSRGDTLTVSFVVETVYGDIPADMEVTIH